MSACPGSPVPVSFNLGGGHTLAALRNPQGVETKAEGKGAGLEEEEVISVVNPKQQLSVDLVMNGCVHSYVDFFYIVHRKIVPVKEDKDKLPAHTEIGSSSLPSETLSFLAEALGSAEKARKRKDFESCLEKYGAASSYFEKIGDIEAAIYVHQRCLEISGENDLHEDEARSLIALGSCKERQGKWEEARALQEQALEKAKGCGARELQVQIAGRLVGVYKALGETADAEGKETALALFEHCLRCAKLSEDPQLEGVACFRLGKARHRRGDFKGAIELHKSYLEICQELDDEKGEAAARGALAHAYEACGEIDEAIGQLEELLEVAQDSCEMQAQATASLNLGLLYHSKKDQDKAVYLLEQHFDLARQLGDRQLVDSARVVLGMARGMDKLDRYIHCINGDMSGLLNWKCKRTPLPDLGHNFEICVIQKGCTKAAGFTMPPWNSEFVSVDSAVLASFGLLPDPLEPPPLPLARLATDATIELYAGDVLSPTGRTIRPAAEEEEERMHLKVEGIPPNYSLKVLLKELSDLSLQEDIEFLYLPPYIPPPSAFSEFKKVKNRGFAILRARASECAKKLFFMFQDYLWTQHPCKRKRSKCSFFEVQKDLDTLIKELLATENFHLHPSENRPLIRSSRVPQEGVPLKSRKVASSSFLEFPQWEDEDSRPGRGEQSEEISEDFCSKVDSQLG